MRPAAAYFLLAPLVVLISVVNVMVFLPSSAKGQDLSKCLQKVGGPTPMYWCRNGRTILVENGKQRDIGPITGTAQVPKA